MPLCRNTCPIHIYYLDVIEFIMVLSSSTNCRTSSFLTSSLRFIPSICLRSHIFTTFIFCIPALFIVYVSKAYKATLQSSVFINFFFKFDFTSYHCLPFSMPTPTLIFFERLYSYLFMMMLPIYLNRSTSSSILSPFSRILIFFRFLCICCF